MLTQKHHNVTIYKALLHCQAQKLNYCPAFNALRQTCQESPHSFHHFDFLAKDLPSYQKNEQFVILYRFCLIGCQIRVGVAYEQTVKISKMYIYQIWGYELLSTFSFLDFILKVVLLLKNVKQITPVRMYTVSQGY